MARLTRENARLAKQLTQTEAAREIVGTSRALGIHLREHGHTTLTEDALNSTFIDLRAAEIPTQRSCVLIGRSRATHYRHQQPPVLGPKKPRTAPDDGQALTPSERARVLSVINSDENADLAICQIWARELDEGNYWCSVSSMYRMAAAAGQNRERRRTATHPPKVIPELLADGPSQVWTWDIT